MPYTPNRRGLNGFVIDEPYGDRPYFCHRLPLEYVRQASARGARVYAFELELLDKAVPKVRELNITRAKVLADVTAASSALNEAKLHDDWTDDEEGLRELRQKAVLTAAKVCRVIEAIDRRLFELEAKKNAE